MKKNGLFFLFFLCIIATCCSLFYQQTHKQQNEQHQPWMTVFVHGSFATLLGLLSLPSVLSDDISNSFYHQINKKMRQDNTFFAKQPILERGLIKIEPSFDIKTTNHKKLGAYPIINGYHTVNQIISPQETNLFYTFGWSGLVSQHRRRLESLRFYNSLTEELNTLHQKGIHPKIRIIAHSHGGNICINLAMIPLILAHYEHLSTDDYYSKHPEACDSFIKMKELIASLPNKEIAATKTGQKKTDYQPIASNFHIDELILLGTPIQIENQCFISSSLFTKIYSIYSEKDIIQELDWVSTKQRISNQRIAPSILEYAKTNQAYCSHIVQTKLMYERPHSQPNIKKNKPKPTAASTPSIISKIFRPKQLQKDPDHKELWFFNWDGPSNKTHSFLTPLPSVVILPFIMSGINLCRHEADLDLNLRTDGSDVIAQIYKHNGTEHEVSVMMPLEIINTMKLNVAPWNPQEKNNAPELLKAYDFIS